MDRVLDVCSQISPLTCFTVLNAVVVEEQFLENLTIPNARFFEAARPVYRWPFSNQPVINIGWPVLQCCNTVKSHARVD